MVNYEKLAIAEQKVQERNNIISNTVESYIDYQNYLEKTLKHLENYNIIILQNSFQSSPSAKKVAIHLQKSLTVNDNDRIEKLQDSLEQITNYSSIIRHLMQIPEELSQKQQNFIESIADFEHFNKVTKEKLKNQRTQKRMLKSIRKFSVSELKPFYQLKNAKHTVELTSKWTTNSMIWKQLKIYIKKSKNDDFVLDKLGFYEIDEEFFRKNGLNLYFNINRKLKENKKALQKGVKYNTTENQLKRYLTY
ncbi:hypothetical protein [Staphylococcus capitis]|uniref:hypothetical protein n=1 Tax=Staphylococcus capitis TaxID=29388 RepID=UPI003823E986